MNRLIWKLSIVIIVGLTGPLYAQQDFSNVRIEVTPVADGLYMLTGEGGNMSLSVGGDGPFLVDDQYAPLTEGILAAIAEITDDNVRFVVNTHWHGDHTGGNENLGEAGALIVAHDNVRARMSTEQFQEIFNQSTPASPPIALPIVTFTFRLVFHWNGNEIHVFHVANAHTDGDAVINYANSNVFHMGDVFFNGLYPFIDVSSGGSIDGMIAAVERVLNYSRLNNETRFIPGHGPLAGPDELRTYLDVLRTVRERIQAMIDDSMSEDQVVAANPTREYDADWGGGFMNPETFTRLVYQSLAR